MRGKQNRRLAVEGSLIVIVAELYLITSIENAEHPHTDGHQNGVRLLYLPVNERCS